MIRVWLPDTSAKFGTLPSGIEADVWPGGEDFPDSADRVEFAVLPHGQKPEVIRKLGTLPRLQTIQILSAGADHILPHVPSHIRLCNARGAHTPATAELAVGMIIASLRNFPRFAVAQHEGRWDTVLSDSVAGKHVLIVGYGDIGAAWAPETIFDTTKNKLMVYYTTRVKGGDNYMVYSYANDAFTTLETAPQFLSLSNVKVCGGSWLTPADAVEKGDWARITRLAAEAAAIQR